MKFYHKGKSGNLSPEELNRINKVWQIILRNQEKFPFLLPRANLVSCLTKEEWFQYTIYRPNLLCLSVVPFGYGYTIKLTSPKYQIASDGVKGKSLEESFKIAFLNLCHHLVEKIKKEENISIFDEKSSVKDNETNTVSEDVN